MAGLIDTILAAVPSSATTSLADQFGESPGAAQTALGGVVPVILAAIASKAQGGGAGGVVDMIRGALSGGNPLDSVAAGHAPTVPFGEANGMLGSLFGSNLSTIVSTLAASLGLKSDSVNGLLAFAAPLVIGGIGRALGGNVSAGGLQSLMAEERPSIMAALPSGIGSMLGLGGGTASGAYTAAAAERVVPPPASPSMGKWLPWLLLGAGILALLLALSRCNRDEAPIVEATPLATETMATVPMAIPTGAGVTTETRDGKPVVVVYFDTAKADVAPAFADSVTGIKSYLDTNAASRLTVSGFNDPTGNAAANAALSKRRAEAVKAALVANGVAGDRVDLVKPAETTDTTTSMENARRVEVVVQ